MEKKARDPILEDFEELQNEIIRDQVKEIFRLHPHDYIARLEELGFRYVEEDSEYDQIEEMELKEEKEARPKNQRQRDLVAFFEGQRPLSEKIFRSFTEEKASRNPNYPLLRRYFKQANPHLKALILYGLDKYPGRIDLLSDLAFFHEFENVLSLLIAYYTEACVTQANLDTFSDLAQDFYYATHPDGYEAYHALRELFGPDSDKRKIIDFLIAEADTEVLLTEEGDIQWM